MAEITDLTIGISSTSKHKEEAWEFIESLLDSEFQDNVKNGLPLRVSSLNQKLEDAMKEADYLFSDDRNIDDVAHIIQNRANVYISESK